MIYGKTDLGIRWFEWGRLYLRTGFDFYVTAMYGSWGIEVCGDGCEWAPYGAVTRFIGIRLSRKVRLQIFFGKISFVPPELIDHRANICIVT